MATYDRGQLVRLTVTFSVGSTPTDPSAVYLYLRAPDGTFSTLQYGVDGSVVKVSTGVYRYDYSATARGDVYYRWSGTGAAQSAEQSTFFVQDDVGPS